MSLRVGVLGGGLMGQMHAQVYQGIPEVELAWIAEPDEARHEALRATLGDVPVYGSPRWDEVSAGSICTPDDVRAPVVLPALASGVRVLVEKPLAMSVREAKELLGARPTPGHLMVGHVLRFDPRVTQAARCVADGTVAELWAVRCRRANPRTVGRRIATRASVDWFLGVHDVDLVRLVTGQEITQVRAWGWNRFSARRDLVRVEAALADGTPVAFEWSWLLPDGRPSGLQAGIELVGADGMLEADLSHNSVLVSGAEYANQLDTYHWPPAAETPGGDLRREIEAFLRSVRTDRPLPVTAEDGMRSVAVIEAVQQSIDTGSAVTVEDPTQQ